MLFRSASGIAVGAFGHRYFDSAAHPSAARPQTPDEYRKTYLEEMSKRLSLSQPQKEKLNEILDETRAKYREVRERHKPEMKAIQDEQVEKVDAMLTESQRTEYAKMRAEREAKRLADEKGRGPQPTSSSK